jgi:hypothetical protein
MPLNRRSRLSRAGIRAVALLCVSATSILSQGKNTKPRVPEGFTPIFNGKDTKGWHWSKTVHHGTNALATVDAGELVLKQHPFAQGGLLISDKRYRNFEFYTEVKLPWGCNSGLFLRSTEGGSAYQVELNQDNGNANFIGELIHLSKGAPATELAKVWKPDDWNSFRVRMTGDAPHVTLWVNGVQMWDVQEPENDKIGGEVDGEIGLQVHWSSTYEADFAKGGIGPQWKPDAAIRFRNLAIKELP